MESVTQISSFIREAAVLTWCVEPCMVGLLSRQLATILTAADDNFTHPAVDAGIALGPVCTDQLLLPLPVELGCWAFYCKLKSLFHGR